VQQIRIINTYPDFLEFWGKYQNRPITIQIEKWASEYMVKWPELLEMQISDYTNQHIAWQQIASEKVFPFLSSRLSSMHEAQQNITDTFIPICDQAFKKLGFETNIVCIIYVGIGCGAGWATKYRGEPAIMFGLENIAECNWSDQQSIAGLSAHEIGHIVHAVWRSQSNKPDEYGPWWQLFSEGFAQRCEHLILGKETWHEAGNSDENWLTWCRENKSYLASEFLSYIYEGKDALPFFGSWFSIDGHSQCGYFLGHEVIKDLQLQGMSLKDIGTLAHPEQYLNKILRGYVKTKPI